MKAHRWPAALFLLCAFTARLWAGGSGLNVVVVVNQNSTNSVQLGNYYREQRQVPPQNFLRINWSGGNISWTLADFTANLYNPLLAMLSNRQLTNQIDYVVLSMDIPYAISTVSDGYNSTTAAIFYGFKPDTNPPCSVAPGSTSLYAGSESIFRSTPPINAASNSFLTMMITSSNLALAKQIVDSGVSSDSTFPTQTVYLAKSDDIARNVRYALFDNAIFNTRLRGNYFMQRIDAISVSGLGSILGAQTGYYSYSVYGVSFAPGAMADNLTSYGGLIFGDNSGQLNILVLLAAGAAGSYGTVTEPCNYLEKFPTPQNYFYQARGFSLAECYYQSLTNPYQGILVGEPLAAPFARPASGSWLNLPANALLSGATNLSLQFTASDSNHPLQQVDLFLDGAWLQTLTNITPANGNLLNVTLNGRSMNYPVPSNATIQSVAAGLTSVLNSPANMNATKVIAYTHGDRIELQSVDRSKLGAQLGLSVSNSIGTGTADTTFIAASGTNLLDSVACGLRNFVVTNSVAYPPPIGAWLQLAVTKTNGTAVTVGVTNTTLGTTVPQLLSSLINAVNAAAQLTSPDGCIAQDFIDYAAATGDPNDHRAEFNLRARAGGWNAAQIQAVLSGSPDAFTISPAVPQTLEGNLTDLEPRAHLYLTAGVTNLPLTFAFKTDSQADGFHELTAVVYEGSHVRTQKHITQNVRIQNGLLAAAFTTLIGDTNSAIEATLLFSVVANTNNISTIELFSTGGSLGIVSNQSSAIFSVPGTNLGLGLHPFYAIVTAGNGKQYRTESKSIRLIGPESPFRISLAAPPPALSWSATAGRSYDILTAANLTNTFQFTASLTPSNSAAQWIDTNASAPQRFYRIRTSN